MTPKVLLVGIDGVDFDRFQGHFVNAPGWHYHKAYTGGIIGTPSQAATYSGPGWATVLTGTWATKHGILMNDEKQRANPKYPWILQRLKHHAPSLKLCSIVTWLPIHKYFAEQMTGIERHEYHENDKAAVDKAKAVIAGTAPAVTFLHLSDPDLIAHTYGFDARYEKALKDSYGYLQALSDVVRQRQAQHPSEDWLILVTTDHGRSADGKSHGGHSLSEKTVFIASNKRPNAELSRSAPIPGLDPLHGHAAHAGIAPTIMRHMGVGRDNDAWGMDSPPLIGAQGVRKPRFVVPDTLAWVSSGSGSIEILKNGKPVATLPPTATQWSDPDRPAPADCYAWVNNDTAATLRVDQAPRQITSAFGWNDEKIFFFFHNGRYSRFNLARDETDAGYPYEVSQRNWPELWRYQDKIIAAFDWTDKHAMFFLDDGTYIRYDKAKESMDGYPLSINDSTWPGLRPYARDIKAAVRWNNGKLFIFLKNNTYLRYDIASDRLDPDYPRNMNDYFWPGVAKYSDKIVCVVREGARNNAYFFLNDATYLKFDMDKESVSPFYPAPVIGNWKGLL
ncbi:hemopexin repeat-containing protein [Pseudomonas sp. NPDC089401]|uniref:hemopexin repeat-containing protein n=1 Tax=Pseudomonas sp. NPDC089401 TaxID=3364462 RepID=UPI0038136847